MHFYRFPLLVKNLLMTHQALNWNTVYQSLPLCNWCALGFVAVSCHRDGLCRSKATWEKGVCCMTRKRWTCCSLSLRRAFPSSSGRSVLCDSDQGNSHQQGTFSNFIPLSLFACPSYEIAPSLDFIISQPFLQDYARGGEQLSFTNIHESGK